MMANLEAGTEGLLDVVTDEGTYTYGVSSVLTMYGESWRESLNSIERGRPMVIVVGGTKVSGEVFRLANHNISIGNQPHSEVAALGVFLESFIGPLDESKHFQGGEIQVVPSLDRKQVMSLGEE